MSHNNGYGQKETNLPKDLDFDLVRTIKDGASRLTTKLNFGAALEQTLINLGFLTSANLPVAVSQIRFYREESGNTSLLLTDSVLGVDTTAGTFGVNMLLANTAFDASTSKGQSFTIKNEGTGGNILSINTSGGDLIEGEASFDIADGVTVTIFAKSLTAWILI